MSFPRDIDEWKPWSPAELAGRLRAIAAPWYVAGGWALDLWHGRETRLHEDLEFVVLRDDLPVFLPALPEFDMYTAHDGVLTPLPPGRLSEQKIFQIWCWERAASCWRVDMMIENGTPDRWIYKRDPAITCPRGDAIRKSPDGVPYLDPAAVLLFKAKYRREKDELDFANALPRLTPADRARLKGWLAATHPGHEWDKAL